jgi:N-acetylneuraminate lyase
MTQGDSGRTRNLMMNSPDRDRLDRPPRLLDGLVAATHTPFAPDGSLAVEVVDRQAEHLLGQGVTTVFIGGSTGESQSLSVDERLALTQRWSDVVRGTDLRLIVHVGANCLPDAAALAAQAERLGAAAVSALAPSYFKPRNTAVLVDSMAQIAAAAPATPFYYYDIPQLTGLGFWLPEVLDKAAARIPTFAGIKFSGPDLVSYQHCLRAGGGRWDIPYGMDECLLAALSLGARGAVGSSYNFAAPISRRLWEAFTAGDLETARTEQWRSVLVIQALAGYGYMGAAKAVMEMLGVPVGRPRLPNASLSEQERSELRSRLETMGFFGWVGGP